MLGILFSGLTLLNEISKSDAAEEFSMRELSMRELSMRDLRIRESEN